MKVTVAGQVNTSQVSVSALTYVAQQTCDGLQSEPVTRTVAVVDPCAAEGSRWCPEYSFRGTVTCATCLVGACFCLPPYELLAAGSTPKGAGDYAPPAYDKPPTLTLLGDQPTTLTASGAPQMTHLVPVGSAWTDPFVAAADPVDGNLTGKVATTFGATGPVNTSQPWVAFQISYFVSNKGGLSASALRVVEVFDPCRTGEQLCGGKCMATCEPMNGGAAIDILFSKPPPAAPPTLRLLGDQSVQITQGGAYIACSTTAPLDALCDRGATATDAGGEDISPRVAMCAADPAAPSADNLFARAGLGACAQALPAGAFDSRGFWQRVGVYTLVFSVRGGGGGGPVATANRTVTVSPDCAALGERLCSDLLSCSTRGICAKDLGSVPATVSPKPTRPPPNMTLVAAGRRNPGFVSVRRYSSYGACAPDQTPTEDAPCDLGATSVDSVDGDITAKVLACPPRECLSTGCAGHEFATKGVRGCVDTTAAVGSLQEVLFVSINSGAIAANVSRVVTILPRCPDSQFECGQACLNVSCAEYSSVTGEVPPPSPAAGAARRRGLLQQRAPTLPPPPVVRAAPPPSAQQPQPSPPPLDAAAVRAALSAARAAALNSTQRLAAFGAAAGNLTAEISGAASLAQEAAASATARFAEETQGESEVLANLTLVVESTKAAGSALTKAVAKASDASSVGLAGAEKASGLLQVQVDQVVTLLAAGDGPGGAGNGSSSCFVSDCSCPYRGAGGSVDVRFVIAATNNPNPGFGGGAPPAPDASYGASSLNKLVRAPPPPTALRAKAPPSGAAPAPPLAAIGTRREFSLGGYVLEVRPFSRR